MRNQNGPLNAILTVTQIGFGNQETSLSPWHTTIPYKLMRPYHKFESHIVKMHREKENCIEHILCMHSMGCENNYYSLRSVGRKCAQKMGLGRSCATQGADLTKNHQ